MTRPGPAGPPLPHDDPSARLTAVWLALDVFTRLGVRQVWPGWCPECGNPVFAEKPRYDVICGFCGHGPFRLGMRPGPRRRK